MPSSSLPSERLRIGTSLTEARERAGLTVEQAADETKIRANYLAALEAEDWAALPSSAYAKGFLRTYSRMLGLDADELVDSYRRDAGAEQPQSLRPFGDPVLEERRRPAGLDDSSGWRGLVLAIMGILALAALIALVIAGDLSDDSTSPGRHHGAGAAAHHAQQPGGAPSGPVTLRLHAIQGAQVCLVGDGRALIDSQSLTPGTRAGPFHGRRFRLDLTSFGGGVLRLRIDGHRRRLRAHGRSSYLIHQNGLKRTNYRGPRCP